MTESQIREKIFELNGKLDRIYTELESVYESSFAHTGLINLVDTVEAEIEQLEKLLNLGLT